MKRKIAAIVCASMLLLFMIPYSATTIAAPSNRLEGVEYTKITAGGGYRVVLNLGNMEFWGDLSCGFVLSEQEQDRIIRQVMNEMNITSGMLINAKSMIDAAENLEGFSIKDVENAVLKLAGVDDALALYNLVMGTGDQSAGEIGLDIAKNQLVDFAEDTMEEILTRGGKVALKGSGKYAFKLFFLLPDLTEIGLDALAKYENIKEVTAAALTRKLLLETFYEECNRRIREAAGDDGVWKIKFESATSTYMFNLWGISGLMSQWTLTGELTRNIIGAGEGASGNYEGSLALKIEGLDMEQTFDKNFINYVNNGLKNSVPAMRGAVENMAYTDRTDRPTILNRFIVWNISVRVPSGGSGEFTWDINSFQLSEDEQNVSINHTVEGYGTFAGTGSVNYRWQEARLVASRIEDVVCTFSQWTAYTSVGGSSAKAPLGSPDTVTLTTDPGTAWKPLEENVVLKVYMK